MGPPYGCRLFCLQPPGLISAVESGVNPANCLRIDPLPTNTERRGMVSHVDLPGGVRDGNILLVHVRNFPPKIFVILLHVARLNRGW
ncbi:MAG: hypothetical protein CM1200mP9_03690 [Gammaproteobacteria bacterium]|nr:MAG: hypothetical protein CM1200mP9_03690 [Gammaproteobacteria bacterium]